MATSMPAFLDQQDFNDLLSELQAETDRAAAILAGAYLDDLLKQLLMASFVDESHHCQNLLEGARALGSFSARIATCYAFGLVADAERFDLDQIRKIRNDFAHRRQGVTFNDESIAVRCTTFRCSGEVCRVFPGFGAGFPRDAKSLFVWNASLLAFYLRFRVSAAKRRPSPTWPLWQPADEHGA